MPLGVSKRIIDLRSRAPRGRESHTVSSDDEHQADDEVCRRLSVHDYTRAMELLVPRFQTKIFHLAYSMLRNPAAAEDMAQEIFLRIWKGLPRYDRRASLSTWIYTISRNTCLSELRKRASRPTVSLEAQAGEFGLDHLPHVKSPSESPGCEMDVEHYLGRLPEKYRRVVVLYYLEQKSYEETAALLGLPLGTVKTLLHRAKGKLVELARRRPVPV